MMQQVNYMNQMAALNAGANQKGDYKTTKVQEEI